ncbi:hypothetical protein CSR02_06025 [Acetobacter pomorum]|uniref:Uncharacterized protein n=1 Tax=Acetobacter pomorum TaxID=65959 RepID=A0A2G4RC96_9PROT|nr:hypothetical protein [Acetobacter pomorum]PHY94219.1 hypothetical protein CSR02_06025 [Acetobacter pomorum]GBR46005.1 hypothetical protein AA11825_0215 [Acetobacter pomorum DSM 11825]
MKTHTNPAQAPTPNALMAQATLNRPRRTVQGLLQAGDITQAAADAAERWCRNYVFGYYDYLEHTSPAPQGQTVRHDAVSWQMVRAQAMARITAVRDALGLCAHQRLRMMLVDDLSFRAMGEALFPTISSSSAQRKIAAQCALVLEQLAALEETFRRAAQEKRKRTPKTTPAHSKVLK